MVHPSIIPAVHHARRMSNMGGSFNNPTSPYADAVDHNSHLWLNSPQPLMQREQLTTMHMASQAHARVRHASHL